MRLWRTGVEAARGQALDRVEPEAPGEPEEAFPERRFEAGPCEEWPGERFIAIGTMRSELQRSPVRQRVEQLKVDAPGALRTLGHLQKR